MAYVLRRGLHSIFLLFGVSVFSFALLELAPGNYFDELLVNPQVSRSTIAVLRSRYGFDEPLLLRYFRWLKSGLHGEFGISFGYNTPVGPLVLSRARNTLLLAATATFLAWIVAIVLGVWSSAGKQRWRGHLIGAVTSMLIVMPELLLALAFLWIAIQTRAFPVGGMTSTGFSELDSFQKLGDICFHLFPPVLVLVLGTLPVLVRHVRTAMTEVLNSPFIHAARAHGIPAHQVLLRYALPATASPLISLFGLSLASLLSASMLVEVMMGWPGLGPLLLEAILSRDVYVVIGAVMLSSLLVVFGNLVADILLYAADPRIRSAT